MPFHRLPCKRFGLSFFFTTCNPISTFQENVEKYDFSNRLLIRKYLPSQKERTVTFVGTVKIAVSKNLL